MTAPEPPLSAAILRRLAAWCASPEYPDGAPPWEDPGGRVSEVTATPENYNDDDEASNRSAVIAYLGVPRLVSVLEFLAVTRAIPFPASTKFGSRRATARRIIAAAEPHAPGASDPRFLEYWTDVVHLADAARNISLLRRALTHAVHCAALAGNGNALFGFLAVGNNLADIPMHPPDAIHPCDPDPILAGVQPTPDGDPPPVAILREAVEALDSGRAPTSAVAQAMAWSAVSHLHAAEAEQALIVSRAAIALTEDPAVRGDASMTLAAAMTEVGALAAARATVDASGSNARGRADRPAVVNALLDRLDALVPAIPPTAPGPRRVHLDAVHHLVSSRGTGWRDALTAAAVARGVDPTADLRWLALDTARARRDDADPVAAAEAVIAALQVNGSPLSAAFPPAPPAEKMRSAIPVGRRAA